MNILNAENVYETLIGSFGEEYGIPGVKNAYADGSLCNELYQQIYWANCRLCDRLGQDENDPDVELIINNFLQINRILCLEMYHYGQRYGYHECATNQ